MRTLKFILQKEFRQIFRNATILRVIFVMPIFQLLILPWAADYEVKNIQLAVVDHDHSSYSRQFVSKLTASGYFRLAAFVPSFSEALKKLESDRADMVLEIPARFERTLVRKNKASLFLAVNAINGTKAVLGASYLQSIIQDYNGEIRLQWMQRARFPAGSNIEVVSANWYNPLMNYKTFMVPGLLVLLITIVGTFLAALNIVREKEMGTIEQINVTPIKKYHFILGKLIPFWIMGLLVLSIGLLIARIGYGIVPVGSLLTLFVFAGTYQMAVLGLGLLVSAYSSTQQQAMLITFFLMMVFILMGGLYTPIESMPLWAQRATRFNPVAYFIEVIRMVVLKGSSLSEIKKQILTVLAFAVVLNSWAVVAYRKRS